MQGSETFKLVVRSLRHRNYRLFFGGQGISLVGTWMQQIALGWLVYRLTDSAFLLGLVGFASQIPTFVLASFAGVLADRFSRHHIIIITQILAMIQASLLAILTLTNSIQIWHIIFLSVFIGIVNAFDMPTRQSFVVDLVEDKNDLPNAIALNSSMFNTARLVGPTVAGILISLLGEGLCFSINAVSFIAVIIALLMMKIKTKDVVIRKEKVFTELKEGIKYAYKFKPIRVLLLVIGIVNLAGSPFTVLMPVFARDILKGNANTLGFLFGAVGIGALVGAIYLASRKSVVGLGKWIAISSIVFASGLILFSFSQTFIISFILMLFTGFGMMVQMASANTLLQTLVDDDKRGRVMSLYVMAFMGTAPIGSLVAGTIASKLGAPFAILSGGLICLFGAIVFAFYLPTLRKYVRPHFIKLGILPEISKGLQTTTHLNMPPNE